MSWTVELSPEARKALSDARARQVLAEGRMERGPYLDGHAEEDE